MKLKKILAGALAAATAVACMPVTKSYARSSDEWIYGDWACRELYGGDGNYFYDLDVEIIKYLGNEKDVVIPAEIDGHKVIGISGYGRIDHIDNIYGGAFQNCTQITSIKIPDSVEYIEAAAFKGCTSLTSVSIPSSVTSISLEDENSGTFQLLDENVFTRCTSLASINVDKGNKAYSSIDGVLFNKDATRLLQYPSGKKDSTYIIPDGVESVLTSFGGQYLETLIIPACVKFLPIYRMSNGLGAMGYGILQNGSSLVSIEVDEENENYCSIDGVLYNKDKTQLLAYPRRKTDTSFLIPNSVESVEVFAFSKCEVLDSVTIPSSVTYLNDCSFANSPSIKSITIFGTPGIDNEYYDNGCFLGCRDDMTIYGIPNSNIEEYAKKNEINFEALFTLNDDNADISITGNLPEDVLLKIEKTSSEETYIGYNITIVDGEGKEVHPANLVEVSIPVPEAFNGEDCIVYRKEADSTYTDMNAVYKDGYMLFVTDHFSEYILSTKPLSGEETPETTSSSSTTENPPETDSEKTEITDSAQTQPITSDEKTDNTGNNGTKPDDNVNTGVLLCFVPAIITAAGVVVFKKRK